MDWNRELMEKPLWKEEIKNREQKEAIARKIAKRVQNGDVIGFGSGSTSYLTVIEIAKKCEEENKNNGDSNFKRNRDALLIFKYTNCKYYGKKARLVF